MIFISYGIGLGLVSMEMFLFYFFNMHFSPVKLAVAWILIFSFSFIIAKRCRPQDNPAITAEQKLTPLAVFLIIAVLFEISHTFFRALIKPMEAYDAVAMYAIKAKIFYLANTVTHNFFTGISPFFPHPDYPLNIPLSETFLCLLMGSFNDQLVKIIFPLYYVAILGILYFGIRRFSSRTYALLFTFILASIPQFSNFSTNGYADVPLSYYYLAGTLFLIYWFRNRGAAAFLYISAVMTALAGWTKNEGLVFCLVNIIVIVSFFIINRSKVSGKDITRGISYVFLIALLLAPWLFVKQSAHLANPDIEPLTFSAADIANRLHRIGPVFYELQRQIFGPKKWNIFWVVFICACALYHKKVFMGDRKYVMMTILLVLSAYIFAHVAVIVENCSSVGFMFRGTGNRLMIHFLPLAVYWLADLLKDELKI